MYTGTYAQITEIRAPRQNNINTQTHEKIKSPMIALYAYIKNTFILLWPHSMLLLLRLSSALYAVVGVSSATVVCVIIIIAMIWVCRKTNRLALDNTQ